MPQGPHPLTLAALGMSIKDREPYRGYYFHVLTAQGPDARGGTRRAFGGRPRRGSAPSLFPRRTDMARRRPVLNNGGGGLRRTQDGDHPRASEPCFAFN